MACWPFELVIMPNISESNRVIWPEWNSFYGRRLIPCQRLIPGQLNLIGSQSQQKFPQSGTEFASVERFAGGSLRSLWHLQIIVSVGLSETLLRGWLYRQCGVSPSPDSNSIFHLTTPGTWRVLVLMDSKFDFKLVVLSGEAFHHHWTSLWIEECMSRGMHVGLNQCNASQV